MARNRVKKKNLLQQTKETLDGKLAIGESKKNDKVVYRKDSNGDILRDSTGKKLIEKPDETHGKIYSWNTYKTYLKHDNYFVQWCHEEKGCKSLKACRTYVDEYLQKLIDDGKSAYTVKMTACAIAKLYDCHSTDFIETPTRHRADIKRSRYPSEEDRHFSEKRNAELINFCRCTGLRRSELEHLRGTDLVERSSGYYIHVHTATKGGRKRYSPIIGTSEEIQAVVERMRTAGNRKVFERVSGHADIHSYRSEYCVRVYEKYARPIEDISNRHEVYHCKNDLKGVAYDKRAMRRASKALGHNRISVIAGNYLRNTGGKRNEENEH